MTETEKYPVTVKPSGWVTLPGEIIGQFSDGILYIGINAGSGLKIWNKQEHDETIERIKAMTREQQIMLRPLFRHMVKCEITRKGNICIPKRLREYAGFDGNDQEAELIVKDGKYTLCRSGSEVVDSHAL